MKQPVPPRVLQFRQSRSKYLVKTLGAFTGAALLAVAFLAGLVALSGFPGEILFIYAYIVGLCSTGGVIALLINAFGSMLEAIHQHQKARAELNDMAWNTQQEELARLQRIMKEEQL